MAQQTTGCTVFIFSHPAQILHGNEHNHMQRYKNSSKLMSVFITFFLKTTKIIVQNSSKW